MNRNRIKDTGPIILRPGANPEAMKADLERRRSGAAGAHDTRPHRQRSRRDAKRAAIREYS